MIQYLFSTKERIRILRIILFENGLTNAEISQKADVNKGLVSIFLRHLMEIGMIQKKGRSYHFRNTPFVRHLKILLNLDTLAMIENEIPDEVQGLGMFGSWAKGENHMESDIDIWLLMNEIDNQVIGEVLELLSTRTKSEVNILPLNPDKWNRMKETEDPFTASLLSDPITLGGVGIEHI